MLSKIKQYLFPSALLLLITGLLTLCSLGLASPHTGASQVSSSTTDTVNCGGSCHPHSQVLSASNILNQEEDDKEPIPPEPIWLQAPINLSLLYTAPLFTFFIAFYIFRKHLLSTQLRF